MSTSPLLTKLVHIHVTPRIPYSTSLLLQDLLLDLHWKHRAASKSTTNPTTSALSPPPPFLLSFSTTPTYTVGRRHLLANPLSPSQISYLTAASSSASGAAAATFHPTSRGGLLTYHGPGQCTAYPIIDLRRFGLSARCYVRLLENAVIRTCNDLLEGAGVRCRTGRSATDPGVWMLADGQKDGVQQGRQSLSNSCQPTEKEYSIPAVTDRKICALGVQVTRGVTAHGVGLNVHDESFEPSLKERYTSSTEDDIDAVGPMQYRSSNMQNQPSVEGYLSWGFSRIVACGLEGKSTTWLTREGADPAAVDVPKVAGLLAENVVRGIQEMGTTAAAQEGIEETVKEVELSEANIMALEGGRMRVEDLMG